MIRTTTRVLAVCAVMWAYAPPVSAYLDPGAGNALLQAVIGAGALLAGIVAHRWNQLRRWFGRRTTPDRTSDG